MIDLKDVQEPGKARTKVLQPNMPALHFASPNSLSRISPINRRHTLRVALLGMALFTGPGILLTGFVSFAKTG